MNESGDRQSVEARLIEILASRNDWDSDDDAWIAALVDELRRPLPPAPPELTRALRAIAEEATLSGRGRHPATLVADSRRVGAAAGVRGDAGGRGGWTLVLSSMVADLLVDVSVRRRDEVIVRGHVLGRDGQRPDVRRAVLSEIDGPASRGIVKGDRFWFESVAPRQSLLTVGSDSWQVEAVLELGDGT